MKAIITIVSIILCCAIRSEILSMMAIIVAGICFLGMIANAKEDN